MARPAAQSHCTSDQNHNRLLTKVVIVDKISAFSFAKLNSPSTFVAPSAGRFNSLMKQGSQKKNKNIFPDHLRREKKLLHLQPLSEGKWRNRLKRKTSRVEEL